MAARSKPPLTPRKQPRQARSTELVAAILEAAVRVLAKEGAQRFTAARVAEKAGVSVGSLYQYFPNKAAILFRLQSDEWGQTNKLLRSLLQDTAKPPFERLRALTRAFIRSECDEADIRVALNDAAPLYRDAPATRAAMEENDRIFEAFINEVLPQTPESTRRVAVALIMQTLGEVGKGFSEKPRSPAEIRTYADAMADMFCAYLAQLAR